MGQALVSVRCSASRQFDSRLKSPQEFESKTAPGPHPRRQKMPLVSRLLARSGFHRQPAAWACGFVLFVGCPLAAGEQEKEAAAEFIDLSLLVATDFPCTWPAPNWPLFQISHYRKPGPLGVYNSDILTIDGNTGTQLDFPPHSIALPDSGLPIAGKFGTSFSDKIAAWQFGGEACV